MGAHPSDHGEMDGSEHRHEPHKVDMPGRARRPCRARRPHRARADVPAALLGLAAALHPGPALQPDDPGAGWVSPCRPSRAAQWIVPVFVGGRLPLRRPALPADGRARAAQPPAGHDDPDLAGDHVAFVYSLAALFLLGGDTLLLGAGDADRHHAAGALAGDAQRAPGLGRARRAGQADARHGRARAARWSSTETVPVERAADGRPRAGPAGRQRPGRWRGRARASPTSTRP